MIQFKCACCNQLLQLGDEWAGKVAKCPYSGQFMQVPGLQPAPVSVPMPMHQAPAPAPAAGNYYNPFAGNAFQPPPPAAPPQRPAGPPPAEFGRMGSAVTSDAQKFTSKKMLRARWQMRGTLLGALGGAMMGAMFGLMFGVAASSTGGQAKEMMLGGLSIIFGGVVLGAGVGGLIGPILLIATQDFKGISSQGAVYGALYGTARVAGFGALGGVVPGLLRGTFNLLQDGNVGNAVLSTVLTALLMAMGWAAAGAILGVCFGAALGALGGYES